MCQEEDWHGEGRNDDGIDDGDKLACNTDCEGGDNDDNYPI